ncbi:SapB/AmfS family lanthipeptide [Streptomyces violaceusniger]
MSYLLDLQNMPTDQASDGGRVESNIPSAISLSICLGSLWSVALCVP